MHVEPQKEHHWLQKLVGEWTYEHEAKMGPDQPPIKAQGKETVRSLGGVWTVGEGSSEMPDGGIGYTIMTLGYDPAKKQFVGTFIGSMMTNLWIYEGNLVGNVLTLEADGPSFAGDGKTVKYRDIIEFKSDDYRTLTAQMLGADGNWNHFMTAHYRRKK